MELLPNENPSPADAEALLVKEMNQLTVQERNNVFNDIHGIVEDGGKVYNATEKEVAATMMELEKQSNFLPTNNPSTTNEKEKGMDLDGLLKEMEMEINKFFYKPAYNQALLQDSQYVKDPELWLHMLRVKLYNVKHAANLIIKFFEAKLELFGSQKLGQKITMDDLYDNENENDVQCLHSGCIQLLPNLSDRAGRAIICYFPSLRPTTIPIESVVRIYIDI